MFNRLNTDKPGQFRNDIAERIGNFLKGLRNQNSKVTETKEYEFMTEIKRLILEKQLSLDLIVNKCTDYLNNTQPADAAIIDCLKQFIAILDTSEYKDIIQKDTLKRNIKTPPAPQLSTMSNLFAPSKKEGSLSINDRLKVQLNNLPDTTISKDDLVKTLIAINTNEVESYNGFFVDLETVTMKKDVRGLEKLSPDQARAEIMRRENMLLFAEIDNIIEKCAAEGRNRIQIIVKSAGHYTPIDIDIQAKSCFIFDAACEPQKYRLHSIHKFSKYIQVVTDASNPGIVVGNEKRVGNLQKDKFSCPLFAIDQSLEVAKMAAIHQELLPKVREYNQQAGIYKVDWLVLPPTIIKNSQSKLFINYYIEKNPGYADEMKKLTNNNVEHFAIKKVMKDFSDKIYALCQYKSPQEIDAMIKSVLNSAVPERPNLNIT